MQLHFGGAALSNQRLAPSDTLISNLLYNIVRSLTLASFSKIQIY